MKETAGRVYVGLLHYPTLDKGGRVITTAVTNMDLHDIARLARTYDLAGYFVIQPLELQQRLVRKLISYWREGHGGGYNVTRKEAFEKVTLVGELEEALAAIERETGRRPTIVGTSARRKEDTVSAGELRERMGEGGSWLIVFGTGWGVEPGYLDQVADLVLEPIRGEAEYNHLSVRTAAAIIIDRLLG